MTQEIRAGWNTARATQHQGYPVQQGAPTDTNNNTTLYHTQPSYSPYAYQAEGVCEHPGESQYTPAYQHSPYSEQGAQGYPEEDGTHYGQYQGYAYQREPQRRQTRAARAPMTEVEMEMRAALFAAVLSLTTVASVCKAPKTKKKRKKVSTETTPKPIGDAAQAAVCAVLVSLHLGSIFDMKGKVRVPKAKKKKKVQEKKDVEDVEVEEVKEEKEEAVGMGADVQRIREGVQGELSRLNEVYESLKKNVRFEPAVQEADVESSDDDVDFPPLPAAQATKVKSVAVQQKDTIFSRFDMRSVDQSAASVPSAPSVPAVWGQSRRVSNILKTMKRATVSKKARTQRAQEHTSDAETTDWETVDEFHEDVSDEDFPSLGKRSNPAPRSLRPQSSHWEHSLDIVKRTHLATKQDPLPQKTPPKEKVAEKEKKKKKKEPEPLPIVIGAKREQERIGLVMMKMRQMEDQEQKRKEKEDRDRARALSHKPRKTETFDLAGYMVEKPKRKKKQPEPEPEGKRPPAPAPAPAPAPTSAQTRSVSAPVPDRKPIDTAPKPAPTPVQPEVQRPPPVESKLDAADWPSLPVAESRPPRKKATRSHSAGAPGEVKTAKAVEKVKAEQVKEKGKVEKAKNKPDKSGKPNKPDKPEAPKTVGGFKIVAHSQKKPTERPATEPVTRVLKLKGKAKEELEKKLEAASGAVAVKQSKKVKRRSNVKKVILREIERERRRLRKVLEETERILNTAGQAKHTPAADEPQGAPPVDKAAQDTNDKVEEPLSKRARRKQKKRLDKEVREKEKEKGDADDADVEDEEVCRKRAAAKALTHGVKQYLHPHNPLAKEIDKRTNRSDPCVREYVKQCLSQDVDAAVVEMMRRLRVLQERLREEQPQKFKAKRRYVIGLKECLKAARMKMLKAAIVAPDVEVSRDKGGLDDVVGRIVDSCVQANVPLIFALSRRTLGVRCFGPALRNTSCIGIFSADGDNATFANITTMCATLREEYDAIAAQNPTLVPAELTFHRTEKEEAEHLAREEGKKHEEQMLERKKMRDARAQEVLQRANRREEKKQEKLLEKLRKREEAAKLAEQTQSASTQ